VVCFVAFATAATGLLKFLQASYLFVNEVSTPFFKINTYHLIFRNHINTSMKNSRVFRVVGGFCVVLIITVLPLVSIGQTSDEKAIRQVIRMQSEAWNKGSIEEYMKGYWQSDSLTFIGKSGPKYGYKTTLENYRKGYPDTAAMGKLKLDLLQMKKLSGEYYYVTGKWNLQRSIGDLQGYFTLLFKKIRNKWVIISDHSS
jgi:ketosteroid isomerase-like protein